MKPLFSTNTLLHFFSLLQPLWQQKKNLNQRFMDHTFSIKAPHYAAASSQLSATQVVATLMGKSCTFYVFLVNHKRIAFPLWCQPESSECRLPRRTQKIHKFSCCCGARVCALPFCFFLLISLMDMVCTAASLLSFDPPTHFLFSCRMCVCVTYKLQMTHILM